ncbi:MAG TPA: hypothetical protein VFQ53_07245 [Kofleriaceae bacterium]|nr:hypothetical protein [Kofleriaceae bacterium]
MITCQRTLEILRNFDAGPLACTADEIEELLAAGLVIEADPDDAATLQWLGPAVYQSIGMDIDNPLAASALQQKLDDATTELKSGWYRFKKSKEVLAAREQDRILLRRVLAVLHDKVAYPRLAAQLQNNRKLPPNSTYRAAPELGDELYAVTKLGLRVRAALEPRVERYADVPLSKFLQTMAKTEAKMQAFAQDVATLDANIGYVKKNRHQVVIGLVKSGAGVQGALDTYRSAFQTTGAPDVAVTLTRNAATFGGPQHAAQRLRAAQQALKKAGFQLTDVVQGAAKTLLAFEPLDAGAYRFTEIHNLLARNRLAQGDLLVKLTARLMPAHGAPDEVVNRALQANQLLGQTQRARTMRDEQVAAAVALASMVREDAALPGLVQRFREIEAALVQSGVSPYPHADNDALECVGCPGTPSEVVDTVRNLTYQVARGREPTRADIAVAVSFAKRFAY